MVSELFSVKFLEILTTGSLEIGKFLQKQSVSISSPEPSLPLFVLLFRWIRVSKALGTRLNRSQFFEQLRMRCL